MIYSGNHYLRLAEVAEYLIDPQVGVIRYLSEQPRESGSPEFFHFAAQACRTEAFTRQRNFRATGGAAADRGRAQARAIGEAVERYCCAIYDANELPVSSAAEAPFSCVEPDTFALFSPEQYADESFLFAPFERTTPVTWVEALDLLTGECLHVPAAMVYVPYFYSRDRGETPIAQPVSTGLACHVTRAAATITAVCEVIERDAFSIIWQAMVAPPRIAVSTLSPANQRLLERFTVTGCRVTLFDLTTDARVAVVLAVQQSSSPGAAPITFAASADLDPETAVRDAIEELAHTTRYMQHIAQEQPRLQPDPELRNIVDQESHLNYWCDPSHAAAAGFLFESEEVHSFVDLPCLATGDQSRALAALIDRISATGHRVLVVDVTSTDIKSLGMVVVRAIIPGYHPLFWNHKYRALGGSRLRTLPRLFQSGDGVPEPRHNPFPHPYP
jgi:ribosomal protein S12 methylthiotransferase accessory factor